MRKRPNHLAVKDLIASTLFRSPGWAVRNLAAFIAVNRLGAGPGWVGVISGAVYIGFLWNPLFSRISAKINLRQSLVVVTVLSSLLVLVTAWVKIPFLYGSLIVLLFGTFGFFEVQYNTLVRHLYSAEERPRILSYRSFSISAGSMLLSALFGRLASGGVHTSSFVVAGALMLASLFAFRTIKGHAEHAMEPFSLSEMLRVLVSDPGLLRAAILLTLYGWVGPGFKTLCVLVYEAASFNEWQVGIQEATSTAGTLAATLLLTPFLRFRGGISNFRLCFSAAALSVISCFVAVYYVPATMVFPVMIVANFAFGISAAGFTVAMQTIGPNLAPAERVTLYVNAIMMVQGLRGLVLPIVVAAIASAAGLTVSVGITVLVAIVCAGAVWVKGIDGKRGVAAT